MRLTHGGQLAIISGGSQPLANTGELWVVAHSLSQPPFIANREANPPLPVCESNALVRATVGVVSVELWDFGVALAGGGGGLGVHLFPKTKVGPEKAANVKC